MLLGLVGADRLPAGTVTEAVVCVMAVTVTSPQVLAGKMRDGEADRVAASASTAAVFPFETRKATVASTTTLPARMFDSVTVVLTGAAGGGGARRWEVSS